MMSLLKISLVNNQLSLVKAMNKTRCSCHFAKMIGLFFLFFIGSGTSTSLLAQESSKSATVQDTGKKKEQPDPQVGTYEVEIRKRAEFKGGKRALNTFIQKNLVYPKEALEKGLSGQVMVAFIVEKDGSVNVVSVVKGTKIGGGCEEEAIRLIKLTSGMWDPAKIGDKKQRMRIILPVNFSSD